MISPSVGSSYPSRMDLRELILNPTRSRVDLLMRESRILTSLAGSFSATPKFGLPKAL
jgi:hypothetical protein